MEKTASDTAKKTTAATFSKECLEPVLNKDLDDSDLGIHSCEFCGTNFESRRGLSSHARYHLRQLGVAVSDSSGAPIDLLCQLMKERGGTLPKLKKQASPVKKYKPQSHKLKKDAGPKLKIKISNLVKKKYALSSSSPSAVKGSAASGHSSSPFAVGKPHKASSKKILVSTPSPALSPLKAVEPRLIDGIPSSSLSLASAKPLWAPQETDAPLNLTTMIKNSAARDDVHVCELCGAWYETRKGLSSHARAHLRQFGVNLKSKGAPIEMLHKIIQSEEFQEKAGAGQLEGSDFEDHTSPSSAPSTSSSISKTPSLTPLSFKGLTSIRLTPPPIKKQISPDVLGNLPLSNKAEFKSPPSAKKKKISLDVSGNMPLSSQTELKSPPSKKKKTFSSNVPGILLLIGKGELKSPPTKKQKISADVSEALPLIEKTELISPPSAKKQEISPDVSAGLPLNKKAVFKSPSRGESSRGVTCEFCHEKFKKSQSLASHARYHLRQLGITEWSVNGSPMATLREVMAQHGSSAGSLSSPGPPSLTPPVSPSVPPSAPPSVPPLLSSPQPITQSSSPPPVPHKVPKAKKGSRTVFPKPKDEPVEVDISIIESPKPQSAPTTPLIPPSDSNTVRSPMIAPKHEKQEPKQFVCCDYCGEMFDTRKALSCHARGHLRQMGARWSLKVPPIEALYELMKRKDSERASQIKPEPDSGAAVQSKKTESSPRTFTLSPVEKEKPASDDTTTGCDATCELCGFDFENRKALASHARAHLRQQGVDWKVIGSPIETLKAWMKSEPGKVAELHKSYMRGDLPFVKKSSKRSSTPYSSSDSESVRLASHKGSSAVRDSAGQPQVYQLFKATVATAREGKAGMSHSSSTYKKQPSSDELSSDNLFQTPTARRELNVRFPRGCERRPPKHLSHSESGSRETESSKPSRTGNIPSLVPRPPETSLVKLVGKVYSLKCRFCEEVFQGPLSIQEDWVMHLQQHILKLKKDSASTSSPQPPLGHTETPLLIGPQAV
ncbi:unnamed protein product [Leuciscus chuanchicus]